MITFGAPRVGNEAFKLFAEAKSNLSMWRYSYDYDIVTRIPTQTALGFHHAGHTVQIWSETQEIYTYWHHIGNEDGGGLYEGAPWYWYCKFLSTKFRI